MLDITKFCNILIVGLGKTGISVAIFLKEMGLHVVGTDDTLVSINNASSILDTITMDEAMELKSIDCVVLSPGIRSIWNPHRIVLKIKELNIPMITDLDILQYCARGVRYIGITGTNGKSTTASLVHHILIKSGINAGIGGNIGIPMLQVGNQYDTIVLELSSYQLENANHAHIDTAAILNITPDHQDHHGSIENYIAAKRRIFSNQFSIKILNYDDPETNKLAKEFEKTVLFSIRKIQERGVAVIDNIVYIDGQKIRKITPRCNMPGLHNMENIAAAIAICRYENLDPEQILHSIESFDGLIHRNEFVRQIGKIVFINDSKATNIDATSRSLSCYDNICLIAGGIDKSDGIGSLGHLFKRISKVFLIGKAQDRFAKELNGCGIQFQICYTMDRAVHEAYKYAAQRNKNNLNTTYNILLSPLCASQDQYSDFEERGNHFKSIVNDL